MLSDADHIFNRRTHIKVKRSDHQLLDNPANQHDVHLLERRPWIIIIGDELLVLLWGRLGGWRLPVSLSTCREAGDLSNGLTCSGGTDEWINATWTMRQTRGGLVSRGAVLKLR